MRDAAIGIFALGLGGLASIGRLPLNLARLLVLSDQNIPTSLDGRANGAIVHLVTTHSAPLRLHKVVFKFALTVSFVPFFGDGGSDDLVEGAVVAHATRVTGLLRPGCLVTVAKIDIWLLHEVLIFAVLLKVDFLGDLFEALFRHVDLLEAILGRHSMHHV